jgi:hypothetical protein
MNKVLISILTESPIFLMMASLALFGGWNSYGSEHGEKGAGGYAALCLLAAAIIVPIVRLSEIVCWFRKHRITVTSCRCQRCGRLLR